jgi:phage anti-repressor protein
MLEINKNGHVYGREIHKNINSKTKDFSIWVSRAIEYADLKKGTDYFVSKESTKGRAKMIYEFTLQSAKEIALLERNEKGRKIRRWLIGLADAKESFELLTVEQSVFAFKVINAMKYVDNQKQAYKNHQEKFVLENNHPYVFAEFAKYRASIVGWNRENVEKALDEFLSRNENIGINRKKAQKRPMPEKLSIIDPNEAIRVAVLDILYAKGKGGDVAQNFAKMCKKMAQQLKVEVIQKNETDLFHEKQNVDTVQNLLKE